MVLTGEVWGERIELGVLTGAETCALCFEPPRVLVDVARAPILLCPAHAASTLAQMQADLLALDSAPRPSVPA
jgi:hypothetical protein